MAPSLLSKGVAEFVGTYLLVFTVGCNVLGGAGVWAAVSIASVLMVSIYALGGISGANFNPAVSLALTISNAQGNGGIDPATACMYMGVQLLAGMAAGGSYLALFGTSFELAPAGEHGLGAAAMCEILYTFMLCFVVLNVAVAQNNQYFGLAIGFVIIAGAYGAGAVSGGCFNPAVALGIDISGGAEGWTNILTYIFSEFVGASLAAVLFGAVRKGEPWCAYLSEVLGTFILVLTVGLNVLGKSPAGAFSIAASLMCMIYALGDVSGAHFNPAVTVACKLSGLCEDLVPAKIAGYMGSQLLGAVLAAMTFMSIYSGEKNTITLGPVGKHSTAHAFAAEVAFTFVLCFIVLGAAVSDKTKTTEFFGLAIGSCVTVGGLAIGGISGGSLNPAVSFGLASTELTTKALTNAAIYSAAEVAGAALAVGAFKVTHAPALEELDKLRP